ncbi:ead/Ea22-like family protein [Salmonella enterica]|nr:ead/Ea22-like family protein [Salmonella enterica]ELR7740870.1 ead/Ea22-like family protein [Salmonella enterica]
MKDKQALREAAEKATPGPWEMEQENIWFTDTDGYVKHLIYVQQGDDVDDKQDHYNTAFIAAFNPKVALALLDEVESKQTFQHAFFRQSLMYDVVAEAYEEAKEQIAKDVEIKARLCRESNSLHDRLRAAERSIAELESKNSNLRTIAHERNELAIRANLDSINDAVEMDRLHKRIAELEAREISLPERSSMLYRTDFHEDYHTVMAYKVSDVIAAIRAAGIKVKES